MSFCDPHVGQGHVSFAGSSRSPDPASSVPSCGRATTGTAAVAGSGVGTRKEEKHCPHHSASALTSALQFGQR